MGVGEKVGIVGVINEVGVKLGAVGVTNEVGENLVAANGNNEGVGVVEGLGTVGVINKGDGVVKN